MPMTREKIEEMITLLRTRYPEWSGFSDPDFVKDEVGYKRQTVAKAHELLGEETLQRLIADGNFETIRERLDEIGKHNNLLFRSVPTAGDLNILYEDALDLPSFCEAVFDLLYGAGDSVERLARYAAYVDAHELPNKWTFPTYFLFICHPESEMFVKPRTTSWLLKFVSQPRSVRGAPKPEVYAAVRSLAHELREGLAEYEPLDMVEIQGLIWVCYSVVQDTQDAAASPQGLIEFSRLFQSFAETYPQTPEGQDHIANYDAGRAQGRENFRQVLAQRDAGQDITDGVLIKLLPYADTESNREKGAWIHLAPCINGDIKAWFEASGWTQPEAWPRIAGAILDLAERCLDDPDQLAEACRAFSDLPYTKGLQTGMLTPLLNALRPEDFALVNNKSRRVINYLAGTSYSQKLSDYAETNATAHKLVEELSPAMEHSAVASLSDDDRFDMFCHWLVAVEKYEFGKVSYWKIAPGEDAWNWDACREGGFIAIGWDELGDLSGMTREQFEARAQEVVEQHPNRTFHGTSQVWRFANEIKEGDRIVANHGTSEVRGVGTVVGEYEFVPDIRHGHRLPVEWDDLARRAVDQHGWRRTLIRLNRSTFRKVSTAPLIIDELPGRALSCHAFELLAALHDNPTKDYYMDHHTAFQEQLIDPFKELVHEVAAELPPSITEVMETKTRLFSRILKNDFGRGGAWDHYWAAFYPKDSKRTEDAQLALWVNHEYLEAAFYIGEYGEEQRHRFVRNCAAHRQRLARLLAKDLGDGIFVFGPVEELDIAPDGSMQAEGGLRWEKWLEDPEGADFRVGLVVPKTKLLQLSRERLVSDVVGAYKRLFPLVLLTVSDDPMPEIMDYLGVGEGEEETELNPAYTLAQCAEDMGFDVSVVTRWVRAIERKGQAILYGPPGTGKTYAAEHLAQHLIGGGDGFVELVQFHPAYAYEDFMQGIRPQEGQDGALTYPMVPGRFLEFCRRARRREGRCVLIIDEINRANLSRVFGELMYLLEYRGKEIPLAGGGSFSIPRNVRLIGTMNTADRSIALVDHALRRRFAFLALYPNYEMLQRYHGEDGFPVGGLIHLLKRVNNEIGDPHYHVGVTFFLRQKLADDLEDIWRMEIEPYLEEFFFDQPAKLETYRWAKVEHEVMLE